MALTINFKNKIALVTGASGGLGRKISATLADCGADIIIHYHSNKEMAQNLADSISKEYGVRTTIYKCDITKQTEVEKMKEDLEKSFGLPDLLVPNAVIQDPFIELLEADPQHFYNQFESCVMQTVYLAKAFIPHMKEQNYGRIVAINTECSYLCEEKFAAYSAAKRGLDGVVRVLAKEVGKYNITINQVAPGWTITDREREAGVKEYKDYTDTIPLRRRGEDQEIANMVAMFLSDYASFTTGAYIPVSGGRVMPGI